MFARVAKKVFTCKVSDHSNLKMLCPKQMNQRLPIPFAQIKVGNTYRNLLNEILQMTDYLH